VQGGVSPAIISPQLATSLVTVARELLATAAASRQRAAVMAGEGLDQPSQQAERTAAEVQRQVGRPGEKQGTS